MTFAFSRDRAPCFPSSEQPSCRHCSRRSDGDPADSEARRIDVIDGAVLARDGICQFFHLQPPAPMRFAA